MQEYLDGLVSVVIPTYNSENFIRKTIDSVFKQTYMNYEIICVDDCSKDHTVDTLIEIRDNHKNMVVERLAKNSGAAVARNRALDLAKGRYIAFLDSDDIWESNKLEKQIERIKRGGGYSFVYSSYDYVNVHGDPISNKCKIKENVKYKDLLTKTYISTPTVLYDRNFYGNVKMPLRRTGQDYAFWLTLLKSGNAFGIDEVLVHVTKRGDSLSKNKFQSLKDVYETQIELEHIGKTRVTFNVIRYCIYAVTKKLGMRFV